MTLTIEQDLLRTDEALLRVELEAAGARFKGPRNCHCPFHDDRTPSAGIYQDSADKVWRFKCQGCGVGGDIFDVRAKMNGRKVGDELKAARPQPRKPAPPPKIYPTLESIRGSYKNVQGFYVYTNPTTLKPDMVVVRWWNDADQRKCYSQYRPEAGGFVARGPEGKLPLYNRIRVAASDTVVVVEGEKCVHALADVGIIATTSPGGAGKAGLADWTPCAGKTCFLWADNDHPNPPTHPKPGARTGIDHMHDVQEILLRLDPPAIVRWVNIELLELPAKGDAADYVERYKGWCAEDIRAQIEADVFGESTPVKAASAYEQYQQDAIDGKRNTLQFPWKVLTKATRALIPGTITCILGDPSASKSLLCTECLVYWRQCEIKASYLYLEDSVPFHISRAHAQLTGHAGLTEAEWVTANKALYQQLLEQHRDTLADLERHMWSTEKKKQWTLDEVADWIEERAKAGSEIIVVDPVTAATPSAKPWIADCEFIYRVKMIAGEYGSRVILVVHPKRGNRSASPTLDDIAGGAAYGRLTHCVIWLEVYDKDEELPVRSMAHHPPESVLPNRIAKILKCRNGIGRGKRIAFDFDAKSLTFRELGLIEKTV